MWPCATSRRLAAARYPASASSGAGSVVSPAWANTASPAIKPAVTWTSICLL